MLKNTGNNIFEDVTFSTNLIDTSWSGDASVIDANNDGYPDIYITNMQGNDEYFENLKGEKFIRKSSELFSKTPWGSMGIKVFDFDNDGQQEIFITDMHSDMVSNDNLIGKDEKGKFPLKVPESFLKTDGKSIFGNAFYKKNKEGGFLEISEQVNGEISWPWGLSVGDLNADGFEDVFITASMNYPFRYQKNSLLLNEHGNKFLDSEFVLGVEPRRDGRYAKKWFELDCDGLDKTHKHCKGKSGKQTIYGACLLYTSPSPRDATLSRMPSSA